VVVEPKQNQRKSATKNTWGGRRPGAGARKGNLNALKPCPEPAARRSRRDGRFSRYQQAFIEALMQVPQTRETMIAIRKRQRAQPVLSRGRSPRVEGTRRAAAGALKATSTERSLTETIKAKTIKNYSAFQTRNTPANEKIFRKPSSRNPLRSTRRHSPMCYNPACPVTAAR
jgi:hypothetical protein